MLITIMLAHKLRRRELHEQTGYISYVLFLQSHEPGAKHSHTSPSCLMQSRNTLTPTLDPK